MKYRFLILIILSSLNCFGQIKEQFLKSISNVIVDSTFSKYYLFADCYQLLFSNHKKNLIVKDFSEHISIELIDELIGKANKDTVNLTWDCNMLNKANCVITSEGIFLTNYFVGTNGKWSEKKQNRKIDRQIKKQKEKHDKKPLQEKVIYNFSRPIFDNKNETAIIEMRSVCGNTCGFGCIYLFKKKNGIWECITKTYCMLS